MVPQLHTIGAVGPTTELRMEPGTIGSLIDGRIVIPGKVLEFVNKYYG